MSTNYFPNLLNLFTKTEKPAEDDDEPLSVVEFKQGRLTWIDVQNPTRRAMNKLAEEYKIHDLHITQCLQKGHIPQVSTEETYIFLTVNFPSFTSKENRIVSNELNAVVGKNFLITVHGSGNPEFRKLFDAYKDAPPASAKYGGSILYPFIEGLLIDTAQIIQKIYAELDDTENLVFDDKTSDAYAIGQLRQKIIGLRRTMTNQSEVLGELGAQIGKFAEGHLRRHFRALSNTSRKLRETTDETKEIIEVYKDVDFTSSTAKTNQILAILTLLFTLTIPATILGTFYGMNVLVPGGIEAGSWTFLGEYTMFKLISGISIVSALLMFLYFRRKTWF